MAYDQVRATVYRSPALVARTTFQLFSVNQQTLSQWHKRWTSAQEKILLTSGIHALQGPRTEEEALLEEEEPQAEEPRAEEPLPGPATVFMELVPLEEDQEPFPATPSSSSSSAPSSSSTSYTPKSTIYNRRRLQKEQAEAARRGEGSETQSPVSKQVFFLWAEEDQGDGAQTAGEGQWKRVGNCPVLAKHKSPEEWLDSLQ
ncbi:hypothetical protein CesoFtcFv8_024730 [Champsocephalus esox]|uniref:Uncharacterized protein n=1 Tax=Champsocephalus esox TaxID=159716 RepID=A0AAN8GIV1_9TELE|nr:hypothetical protein CesoFtcFv8_024730 [Champsocephalus esox]